MFRFATQLRQLRANAGRPSYRELAGRAHYSATTLSDAAGGRTLPTLAVTLAYVAACGGDVAEWEQRWHAVAAELARPGTATDRAGSTESGAAPYVGLACFQAENADLFFGREQAVHQVVTRLAQQRFLAVFGASGIGKSSLLRAGVVPRFLTKSADCRAIMMTPGPRPLDECAIQLANFLGQTPAQLHRDLIADAHNLNRGIRAARNGQELLIVVDQFEEVFTLCHDEQERARFLSALLAVAQEPRGDTRVVLGIRADFYARCSTYPHLVSAMNGAQLLLGPMTNDELREAITYPAHRSGCRVEGALQAAIVADAAGEPGALPLVSHCLLETWRRRRGNTLTLAGYQAAGGIRGALAQSAEAVFTSLTQPQQLVARNLFLRLTALGEGTEDTKRRIDRTELDGDDADTQAVLTALAAARLVTLGTNTVDLAHEALISAWPRLQGWLNADREGRRVHRQLTEAARTWASLERDPGALLRGTRLAITREWLDRDGQLDLLNAVERDFLATSMKSDDAERARTVRRTRQLRWSAVTLAVLLVAASVATVVAVGERRDAQRLGRIALSRQLATQAVTMADFRPDTAMLLSVHAFRTEPTLEARSAVLSMSAHQAYHAGITAHDIAISDLAFSPDGRVLATVSKDKTTVLWDADTHTRLATIDDHDTWLRAVAFSPDGTTLATAGDDRNVMLFNTADRTPAAVLAGHTGSVDAMAFNPDGTTLASASADHTVILWDPAAGVPRHRLTGHAKAVHSVAFRSDGRLLATGGADHTVRLWDPDTGRQLAALTGHTDAVDSLAFSPDGTVLASASRDHTVRLWDVGSRAQLATLTNHTEWVRAVAFSPDGRTLATAAHDKTIILWDLRRRTPRARLTGHTNNIYALAFRPRSGLLATAGEDGAIILWNPDRVPLVGPADWVTDVTFRPDGRALATAGIDQTILWNLDHHTPDTVLATNTGLVNAAAFSPDGHTLATVTGSALRPEHHLTLTDTRFPSAPVTLTGHTDRVLDVAFSPDGHTVATASIDKTVRLWDVGRRAHLATLAGHTDVVQGVAFSPDGRTLATASHDRTVKLWDIGSRAPLATLSGHTGWVRTVAFNPNGRFLASSSIDKTVRLWDLASRTHLTSLPDHTDADNGIAFSPDGHTIAYTSSNHTILLWHLDHATPWARLTAHTGPVKALAYSPDGRTLATASTDQTVLQWSLDPYRTSTQICATLARNLTPLEWQEFIPELPHQPTCPSP